MGSIKPYKETSCADCRDMEDPDDSIKITVSGRCLLGPHFHHQKYQAAAYKEKQALKQKRVIKSKATNPRQTDLSKRTLSSLLDLAQETFNRFIRLRDSKGDHFICISCNRFKSLDQMNAGHYYSQGNHSYLRFNEHNVHGQCIKCNCHMHGHLLGYQKGLLKKIGPEQFQILDTWKNFSQKWDKLQVIALIQLYREKCKAFV